MTSEQIEEFLMKYREEMMNADVNGDGKILLHEYIDKVNKEMDEAGRPGNSDLKCHNQRWASYNS